MFEFTCICVYLLLQYHVTPKRNNQIFKYPLKFRFLFLYKQQRTQLSETNTIINYKTNIYFNTYGYRSVYSYMHIIYNKYKRFAEFKYKLCCESRIQSNGEIANTEHTIAHDAPDCSSNYEKPTVEVTPPGDSN